MHYLSIFLVILASFLTGCSPDPEQKNLSTLSSPYKNVVLNTASKTVTISIGESDKNYAEFKIHAYLLKRLIDFKSTSDGISDGLTSQAYWDGLQYISSAKKNTFTELQISDFDVDTKMAQFTFAAMLIEDESGQLLQILPVQYHFVDKDFDKLIKLFNTAMPE